MKHIFLALFLIAYPPALFSQTFYGAGVSAATSRQAGVYTPSADNPMDALSLNPAGLSALNAPVLDLSITAILGRGSFSNLSNSNSSMSPNTGVTPFFAFGSPVGQSKWSFGFGITPDLLSAAKWHYADALYGAQHEKSEILAYRGSTGLTYKITPTLSVGATFGVIFNENRLDMPYIFQSNPDLAGLKTLLRLHTSGLGYNGSFGFSAQPSRRWNLGGSYRTSTDITSHGTANGNMGAQFAALGIPFQPTFAYLAQVHVQLPPSALFSLAYKLNQTTTLNYQTDWTGWHGAFNSLPVTLTKGNNTNINVFLGSTGLKDTIPLDWKDQFTFRASLDRAIGENFSLSAGFLHGNNPVPNSTLSPLTAAIMQNGIAAGAGYKIGHLNFNLSYGFDFTATANVGQSLLLSNEFSHARTQIGTQALTFTTSFRL